MTTQTMLVNQNPEVIIMGFYKTNKVEIISTFEDANGITEVEYMDESTHDYLLDMAIDHTIQDWTMTKYLEDRIIIHLDENESLIIKKA